VRNLKNTYAVTLIELLLAISLLVVVMLAVSAIDIVSRRQLKEVDLRTTLYNEINYAMESIVKNVSQAVGIYSDPAVCVNSTGTTPTGCPADDSVQSGSYLNFRRQDTSGVAPTFSNLADNPWGVYRLASNEIQYSENSGSTWDSLTRSRISSILFTRGGTQNINSVNVRISAREKPLSAVDPLTNPEVTVESNITVNGMSAR